MNIDLLLTRKSEAGLVTDTTLNFKPSHIILDYDAGHLSLYAEGGKYAENGNGFWLNIPLSTDIQNHLIKNFGIHMGYIKDGLIQDIICIPLVISTSCDINVERTIPKSRISVIAFEIFMKECFMGQAVHRDDINGDNASGVLHDVSPSVLKFTPSLVQQKSLEKNLAYSLGYSPTIGLGLGGTSVSYAGFNSDNNQKNKFSSTNNDNQKTIVINPISPETSAHNPMAFFKPAAIKEKEDLEKIEKKEKAQLILDKDINEILKPIHCLIGMAPLKEKIESIANLAQAKALRTLNDLPNTPLSLHMIFTGPPGTGKTTAAREIGKILKDLGYLATGHIVETSPHDLAREGISSVIENAIGGILFIDEAYAFFERDWDETSPDIPVLLKSMEDNRDKFVVILAGYQKEMRKLIQSNSGLESRFPITIDFPNYSGEEMVSIFKKMCDDHGYSADKSALDKLRSHFKTFRDDSASKSFGNGRGVRNFFEKSLLTQSNRVMAEKISSPADMRQITADDILHEKDKLKEISPQELEDLLIPLNKMIGLDNIKQDIQDLVHVLQAHIIRKKMGLPLPPLVLHSLFIGPSGTGKTSIARILGEIYKRLGFLDKGHVVEVDKSKLVGRYLGWTTQIATDMFHEAEGGILFIDEAYALVDNYGTSDGYGSEALTTILKLMEDKRDNIIVICAGYEKEMENFLKSNSGLESRFPRRLKFNTYTPDEMVQIFSHLCKENEYAPSMGLLSVLKNRLSSLSEDDVNKAGNGRLIRNIFEKTIVQQSRRIVTKSVSVDDILCIEENDLSFPENITSKRVGFF